MAEAREPYQRHINIDGKLICGSGKREKETLPIVSVWVGAVAIILGQRAVNEKSNEITAIPKLLGLFEVCGAPITIDALGRQTKIANKIREKAGNYMAVKDNQKTLHQGHTEVF